MSKNLIIEGDKESVLFTALSKQGRGYMGISSEISKQELINKLIEEGTLEDGETVYLERETK